jgi:hypothetical protein
LQKGDSCAQKNVGLKHLDNRPMSPKRRPIDHRDFVACLDGATGNNRPSLARPDHNGIEGFVWSVF